MTPLLTPFARADWTAHDVERAAAESLAINSWRVPAELAMPAAYLARLLRGRDPADRPTAGDELYDAHLAAVEAAEATYARLRSPGGPPCPHGMPAGDVPSPVRRILACPSCRASATPG